MSSLCRTIAELKSERANNWIVLVTRKGTNLQKHIHCSRRESLKDSDFRLHIEKFCLRQNNGDQAEREETLSHLYFISPEFSFSDIVLRIRWRDKKLGGLVTYLQASELSNYTH